ncbi:DUF250 domain membrane protein [Eremomyces bilateralis CBS 781.70]|uniref:DUF250 domain membrane protein n=1 Tax=Eremomyces bilateralis CBS 781.70 TaxID=1392243 RepID=A0A6G1GE68_9PEZI|nr:DUF250 domain membrane protein [Eremomyces bilateralis CBS 781.70]KAF1816314.1 DUF250 domain membrane protein [Eremomyces bilateralis CBS 781.70]
MSQEEKTRLSGDSGEGSNASNAPILPTVNPAIEKMAEPQKGAVHAAVYIAAWIALSSTVILFNKQILDRLKFHYPIFLTTWHLGFATLMTQVLARTTNLLDSRKKVPMTGRVYLRAIVPIGVFFSLSLICGNVAYLYLSVSFIQMLKATTPVAVLLTGWALGTQTPNFRTLANVMLIVVGVMIASAGEIQFVIRGVLFQICGLTFEAIRIVMVERLLSSAEFKMDPIVSLYYFAPACTVMNGIVCLFLEIPNMQMQDILDVGLSTLFLNGMVAFGLNVAVVLLIGKTSSLVYTLSGVLKDIILVVASMFLFGDPVTILQAFGYGIALTGLVYYKLGAQRLKEYIADGKRSWDDYGQRQPVMRKIIVFGLVAMGIFIVVAGLTPQITSDYDASAYAKTKIGELLGEKGMKA